MKSMDDVEILELLIASSPSSSTSSHLCHIPAHMLTARTHTLQAKGNRDKESDEP
jgi:hypothetical protein